MKKLIVVVALFFVVGCGSTPMYPQYEESHGSIFSNGYTVTVKDGAEILFQGRVRSFTETQEGDEKYFRGITPEGTPVGRSGKNLKVFFDGVNERKEEKAETPIPH